MPLAAVALNGGIVEHERVAAEQPSVADRVTEFPDADRWSRLSSKGPHASFTPPFRFWGVLVDVRLDELHQHIGHILPLGSGDRFKAVVKFERDIQVHSLHLWLFADPTHLLSSEVSI